MKLVKCFAGLATIVALMSAAGAAFGAQKSEPTIYIVKKGDTLWGLSDRFMKDPYYWPDMWATNTGGVRNPHFIYPGQKLRIYPDRIEVEPQQAEPAQPKTDAPPVLPQPQAPVAKDQPVEERTFFNVAGGEGFIAGEEFKPVGLVIAGQHNRKIYATDDILYTDIGRMQGAKVGDRFTAYRKRSPISHPVTNLIIGYSVVPLGTIQLTELSEKSSKALVTESYIEIEPGASLLPYKSRKKEVALKAPEADLSGYIVETRTGFQAISVGDIAYIDLGERQGAKPGNILYVIRNVKVDINYFSNADYDLPVDVIGALVILETGENSSTAMVVKSVDTIYKGDRLEMKKGR